MNDNVFYVLGLSLVAVALVVSFVGLRFDKFPNSRGLLVVATVAIAAMVVATMTFAWRNAADEQDAREAELAADVTANEESGDTTEADEEAGSAASEATSTTASTTATTTASSVDGAQVFATAGCTGCHTLADAGSTGTTGPDLDATLKGKDETFIRESIVDPSKFVEKGFPPNVMPQTYGDQLSPEELDALVSYLSQVTSG
jgi:mono/diheme cytochrome c family protein